MYIRFIILIVIGLIGFTVMAKDTKNADSKETKFSVVEFTEEELRSKLTDEEYDVMRNAGTEKAGSSPLNNEKRSGTYVCKLCKLPLFKSSHKFDSGTGWPSFFNYIEGHLGFKKDFKLILPRTEYHCAKCGSHHGHVFKDGPKPTGLRYCNNGIALEFIPNDNE